MLAIKRVNELDYYNLGRDQLSAKVNLTGPKTSAAIEYFKIKDDPESYTRIKIGNTSFDRYSQKAISIIKAGLLEKSIMEIWEEQKIRKKG